MKSINRYQHAQSMQANMGLKFLPSPYFLHVKEQFYIMIQSVVRQNLLDKMDFVWLHD